MRARALAAVAALLLTLPLSGQSPASDDRPTAIVLCYHIVESPQDPKMEISRETFRQHLQYLEMTGYNVISLRDLYEYVAGERPTIPENAVVITIDDGWSSAYTEAFPELKKRNFPFTLFIYPNIIGKTTLALTWEQIREMAEAGADIQSHSLSHPFLTRGRNSSLDDLQYAGWLRRELAESKRIIEQRTGRPVEFLAYPYGDYDTRVARMAARAGYAAALTCDFGRVRPGSDPLRMKRFVIDKTMSFADFRRYLGARKLQIADVTPRPGESDEPTTIVSVRIPNHERLDPASVGLALLSLGSVVPYSYDARTGSVSLVVNEAPEALRGREHRAVVWAREFRSGKRVEASWTFRFGRPEEESEQPAAVAARLTAVPPATAGPAANDKR
ncbi:MAG TPA: polysaccharide deacetylase family protein [Thermoanaerobaculia bacterium]|nr:polysaccharide deacetylase family protein [Thermoanaerobaculia bacterium]